MNKILKGIARLVIPVTITTLLVIGARILFNGMWLLGLPAPDELQSVTILSSDEVDEKKKLSAADDMEIALKLTGFLKYDIFGKADTSGEPLIIITYHLKNGTDKTVSANNTTVWWNGKAYPIKEKELFINLTRGIFFKKRP